MGYSLMKDNNNICNILINKAADIKYTAVENDDNETI
jgi:hypothetical protein